MSKNTLTITDNRNGKSYEIPISDGTIRTSDLRQIKVAADDFWGTDEEAIFKSSAYGGEVIFFDSKDKCDVKAVFGVAKQKPGKYVVTVSREDDDWYEVFGTNSYIKTSSCLSLALGEDAYLTISPSGFGSLRFRDGDDCMVEGVYTKLRL